jgi:hypothetical protein
MLLLILTVACRMNVDVDVDTDDGEEWPWEGPPLTVRVVDQADEPVAVDWLAYYDPATAGPPETLPVATCAEGEPPCSEWVVEDLQDPVTHVSAQRWQTDREPPDGCAWFASAATPVLRPPDPAEQPQLVHLVLPDDATWCVDGVSLDPFGPVHEDDVRFVPDVDDGNLVVETFDLDGEPTPAAMVNWYHPPEGPEYDGEHRLQCTDALCTRWTAEVPEDVDLYVSATYYGPLHPEIGTIWLDFAATPLVVGSGGEVVELRYDTTLESAFDGAE